MWFKLPPCERWESPAAAASAYLAAKALRANQRVKTSLTSRRDEAGGCVLYLGLVRAALVPRAAVVSMPPFFVLAFCVRVCVCVVCGLF